MKILCVIDSFRHGGGAQTQLAGLASMLCDIGHEVTAFSYFPIGEGQFSFEEELVKKGVKWMIGKNAISMYDKYKVVYQAIKSLRADVVIAYLDGPAAICCIIKALSTLQFKLIVSERNVTQTISLKERIKFHLYKKADVIVPNAYSQELFIRRHFPFLGKKLITINNFVDTDLFKPVMLQKHDNRLQILVVARISPQKNVLRFIKAMGILKKRGIYFEVDWYGMQKRDQYAVSCFEMIKTWELEREFRIYPVTDDVTTLYSEGKYDVFCLPSLFEGCPNSLSEAMSSGYPVLCSDVCDNARYIDNMQNGYLFNPMVTESIVNVCMQFAAIPYEKRVVMGKCSSRLARERLSKTIFINKYIELLS